jgi:hypothetical protein
MRASAWAAVACWPLLAPLACLPAAPGDHPQIDAGSKGGSTTGMGSGGTPAGTAGAPGLGGSGWSSAGAAGPGGGGGSIGGAGEGTAGTGGAGGGTTGVGSGAAGSDGGRGGTGTAGAPGGTGGSTAGRDGAGGRGGAGTGGGPGGSSGAACPTGAFLCEGFEAHPVDASPGGAWTRDVRGGGQINVGSARPFSGAKALHVTGMMNSDRANVQMPVAVPADTVFVRFMMYTLGYPSSSGVHTRLLRLGTKAGAAAGTPDSSYALASYNGTAIEKVNSIYMRSTSTHFNDAAVKDRWVCWEFEIDKTGGVGKVAPHIWIDGRELSLASAGSSSHGGTSWSWDPIAIELLIVGLDGFQSDPVRADFWIDDLVVHSQRVGCPPR